MVSLNADKEMYMSGCINGCTFFINTCPALTIKLKEEKQD